MRHIHYLYTLSALALLTACSEDEVLVENTLDTSRLSFVPVMGGAVMHYILPDDNDVVGIHVRYLDAYGKEILRTGSAMSDSLMLVGFNEARQDVPAQITLQLFNREETAPIDVKFSTLDSAPIQFINSVEINSGWDGFSMDYTCPEGSTGMGHVFYLGTNPHSGLPDTILMNSFTLVDGSYTEIYKNKQSVEHTTVVVRAEDYRGYMVGERVFENVSSVTTAKLDTELFKVYYSNSLEIPEEKIGLEYLTDGDNRGTSWFEDEDDHVYHTFLSDRQGAGPESVPMYIDLGQLRLASQLRLYAYLDLGDGVCYDRPCWGPKGWCMGRADGSECKAVSIWKGDYSNLLPCAVTVYGCRENNDSHDWDSKQWEKLTQYSQDPDTDYPDRWCYDAACCGGMYYPSQYRTLAKAEAATPIYMPVDFPANGQGEGFRYLKIVFDDVFHSSLEDNSNYVNTYKYLSFHELEVYSNRN